MNVLLLVFNLIPAFPLDGGRIARSIIWRVTGDKRKGTRIAAKLGQAFAILLAGVGIWLMFAEAAFTGLWLIALAFLLGQSARGALVQTALTERIEGVRVADIMDRQPVAIPADTPVTQALDEYFLRYRWSWFPVIDEDGRFVGIARQERLQAAIDGGEGWLTVGAVVESESAAQLAGRREPPADRAAVVGVARPARRADGRRRRGRAARRGHGRAGPPRAAVGVRARHHSVAAKAARGCDRPGATGLDAADFAPK